MTETKLLEKRVCENNTENIVKNGTNVKNYKHGKFLWFEFETELKWYNITLLSIFHILFLYGVLTYSYGLNLRTLCAVIWCKLKFFLKYNSEKSHLPIAVNIFLALVA